VVGVDRIEARLAKLGEATVEIVAVVFSLPHGIQPDGKQRLAVDEDHAVVAHGGDARCGQRLHRDPPQLLARVAGEIAGLDEHAVQIGPSSRFRVRAIEPRIGESGFIAGDDVWVVPAEPHDSRLCGRRGRQLELRLSPLRAGAAQVQSHGIAKRVALAIEPADRAARTFPAPSTPQVHGVARPDRNLVRRAWLNGDGRRRQGEGRIRLLALPADLDRCAAARRARRPAANGQRRVIVRNRPVFDRRQPEDRLERLARLVSKRGSDAVELRGDRRAVQERFHRMAIDTHAVGAIGQREH